MTLTFIKIESRLLPQHRLVQILLEDKLMSQHKLTQRSTFQILLLVLLTLLLATSALGQTNQSSSDLSKFAFFMDAGVAVPHGDISFFLDPGFSIRGGLEYMITDQFSAEGSVGYQRFGTFFGGSTNLYQVSGNGKFYLVDQSTRLRPFVNGGVGVYVTDSATTHFGGNVGAGVLYEVTPSFGIQGSYNFNVFTAGSGTKFSTVQGGVRFRF